MKILNEHKKILALRLRGAHPKRIASELGISSATFNKIIETEVFELAMDLAVEIVTGDIPYHPSLAAKKKVSEMEKKPEEIQAEIALDNTQNPKQRLQALRDITDRGWGKPAEHVVLDNAMDIIMRVHRPQLERGMLEE